MTAPTPQLGAIVFSPMPPPSVPARLDSSPVRTAIRQALAIIRIDAGTPAERLARVAELLERGLRA